MKRDRKVYEVCALVNGHVWLSTGVRRGSWGIGCTICAEFNRSRDRPSGRQHGQERFSRFASFHVHPRQAFAARAQIQQHSRSESHSLALRHWGKSSRTKCMPSDVPQPLACKAVVPDVSPDVFVSSDVKRLKGNVPTPAEWASAWSELTERISLRKAARAHVKKDSTLKDSSSVEKRRKRYRKELVVASA